MSCEVFDEPIPPFTNLFGFDLSFTLGAGFESLPFAGRNCQWARPAGKNEIMLVVAIQVTQVDCEKIFFSLSDNGVTFSEELLLLGQIGSEVAHRVQLVENILQRVSAENMYEGLFISKPANEERSARPDLRSMGIETYKPGIGFEMRRLAARSQMWNAVSDNNVVKPRNS